MSPTVKEPHSRRLIVFNYKPSTTTSTATTTPGLQHEQWKFPNGTIIADGQGVAAAHSENSQSMSQGDAGGIGVLVGLLVLAIIFVLVFCVRSRHGRFKTVETTRERLRMRARDPKQKDLALRNREGKDNSYGSGQRTAHHKGTHHRNGTTAHRNGTAAHGDGPTAHRRKQSTAHTSRQNKTITREISRRAPAMNRTPYNPPPMPGPVSLQAPIPQRAQRPALHQDRNRISDTECPVSPVSSISSSAGSDKSVGRALSPVSEYQSIYNAGITSPRTNLQPYGSQNSHVFSPFPYSDQTQPQLLSREHTKEHIIRPPPRAVLHHSGAGRSSERPVRQATRRVQSRTEAGSSGTAAREKWY
jgi:hypothetical protein